MLMRGRRAGFYTTRMTGIGCGVEDPRNPTDAAQWRSARSGQSSTREQYNPYHADHGSIEAGAATRRRALGDRIPKNRNSLCGRKQSVNFV